MPGLLSASAVALLLAIETAGGAPQPAPLEAGQDAKQADPNERICEKITMVGSRLAVRRVCATRGEWADRKREEQQFTDRIQRGIGGLRCTEGVGSARKGTPSC